MVLRNKEVLSKRNTNANGLTVIQLTLFSMEPGFIVKATYPEYAENSVFITKYEDQVLELNLMERKPAEVEILSDVVFITSQPTSDGQSAVVSFKPSLLPPSSTDSVSASLTMTWSPEHIPALLVPSSANPGISLPFNGTVHGVMEVHIRDGSTNREIPIIGNVDLYMPLNLDSTIIDVEKVAAWYYDEQKAVWIKSGYGKVLEFEGIKTWFYTAPHLSWWMAAEESKASTKEPFSGDDSEDFALSFHVIIIICVVCAFLVICIFNAIILRFCCKCSRSRKKRRPDAFDRRSSDEINMTEAGYINHGLYHADITMKSKIHSYDVHQNDVSTDTFDQKSPVVMVSQNQHNKGTSPRASIYYTKDASGDDDDGWIL
ncbi:protein FAM171A1-like [Saccoglossus kowalevskii]|uniref:Protein FAM171B-like n=1 Tax=Saccoglossus kowalevskii TaxID=10224 RepID=A0ABM0MFL6_SACKO|nr:PREDICTED: protein FAM171B-like [Saccoglossus kowalevskii]